MRKYKGYIRLVMKEKAEALVAIVLVTILLFLLFVIYGANVPNKWYKILTVTSGSMAPAIHAGDAIVIKPAPSFEELEEGMIVTFSVRGNIVTHRIIEINETDGIIITKGDANETVDHFYGDDGAPLYLVEVGGEHLFTIPKLGYLLKAPQLIAHATRGWLNDASNVGSLAVGVVTFTPTATLEPTATKVPNTATPKPTATDIPDTETPEPTATSEPQDTAVPEQTATSESTSEIQETEAPTEEPQSTSTPEGIDPTPEGG